MGEGGGELGEEKRGERQSATQPCLEPRTPDHYDTTVARGSKHLIFSTLNVGIARKCYASKNCLSHTQSALQTKMVDSVAHTHSRLPGELHGNSSSGTTPSEEHPPPLLSHNL